jgi:uncharacterized PurR-regulated membrane protein YhhQ (DUF165 family)
MNLTLDTRTRRALGVAAGLAFITCIAWANYLTTTYGLVTILGVTATAGTVLAGATFVFRDSVQDVFGKAVVLCLIVAGIGFSLAISDPRIAWASAAAFGVAELVDMLIYTPLRKRGYVRAALASNVAGSFVDTVVFLAVAGFPIWSAVPGQMLLKFVATAVAVGAVVGFRFIIRPATPATA